MMRFGGWKVKGQGLRVNKCIFHSNDYYAYVNAHLTDYGNTATVWTEQMCFCQTVKAYIIIHLT